MAARSIGSLTISLGLVTIPAKLYTATSSKQVGFNHLHATCGSRVTQVLRCPKENVEVPRSDVVKGFEFTPDQWVRFTAAELEAIEETGRPGELRLVEFVPASTLPLIHVSKAVHLGPDKGAAKAYRVLAVTLAETGWIGIGKLGTKTRDELVAVAPFGGGTRLAMFELHYADEVKPTAEIEVAAPETPITAEELALARKLTAGMFRPAFDAAPFADTWAARLKAAVDRKVAGGEITRSPAAEEPVARVYDLTEALRRSVDELGPKKAKVRAAAPRSTARRRAG